MKSKALSIVNECKNRKTQLSLALAGIATVLTQGVYAAGGNATGLMETLLKMVAVVVTAYGGFLAIGGLVAFAGAHADGDGPAQNKAIGKMAAGVMVMIVSILIFANAGTITGFISTSI